METNNVQKVTTDKVGPTEWDFLSDEMQERIIQEEQQNIKLDAELRATKIALANSEKIRMNLEHELNSSKFAFDAVVGLGTKESETMLASDLIKLVAEQIETVGNNEVKIDADSFGNIHRIIDVTNSQFYTGISDLGRAKKYIILKIETEKENEMD